MSQVEFSYERLKYFANNFEVQNPSFTCSLFFGVRTVIRSYADEDTEYLRLQWLGCRRAFWPGKGFFLPSPHIAYKLERAGMIQN